MSGTGAHSAPRAALRRFVVLDRDGTLNVERSYLSRVEEVELLPRAAEGLRRMRQLGLGLVVLTNQSAVGRGFFDLARLGEIHARLRELLRAEQVEVDGIYVCPHAPEQGCACRKPRLGLLERAAAELGFVPREVFVVGDKACDIELGRAAGATAILVRTGYGVETERELHPGPDHVVDNLLEAAELLGRLVSRHQVLPYAP